MKNLSHRAKQIIAEREYITIATLYFDLSNKSDFEGIAKLFTGSTTYISQTTGTYKGSKDIMAMQRAFHRKFATLNWQVNSVKELKTGVILFDYDFIGRLPNGEVLKSSGLEYITVKNSKIEQVEIHTKNIGTL